MAYRVKSLNVGVPKTYDYNGQTVATAFVKKPVTERLWLSKNGLLGDAQADTKNHGGEDKALLMYPYEHYRYWENHYQKQFELPAFGENVTIEGLTEKKVCIGDVFRLGEAIIQVSQPRNPCYKIAMIHHIKDIPAHVTESGFSGVYFRVIEEGYLSAEDTLQLTEADSDEISVSFVSEILHHDKQNRTAIEALIQHEALAASIRNTLKKRLANIS